MSFRKLARVVPASYLALVAEEAPGFVSWAKRNALPALYAARLRDDQRPRVLEHARGHGRGHARQQPRPTRRTTTLVVTQVTSILTVPLWKRLTRTAIAESRLSRRDVTACVLVAGIVHAGVIARQVFFVGVPDGR